MISKKAKCYSTLSCTQNSHAGKHSLERTTKLKVILSKILYDLSLLLINLKPVKNAMLHCCTMYKKYFITTATNKLLSKGH